MRKCLICGHTYRIYRLEYGLQDALFICRCSDKDVPGHVLHGRSKESNLKAKANYYTKLARQYVL